MNPETRVPLRRRCLGGLLMALGLLIGLGFWWWAIGIRSSAPDYSPHRSPAGFWNDVQTALHVSWWRYEHSVAIGAFGDKGWAEKIMKTVAAGKDFEGYEGRYRDGALSYLTNHDFSSHPDTRKAWLDWWRENQFKTQEQWIQEGFKLHGFDVALPPSKEDWPVLLKILGTTAGPDPRGYRKHPEMLYPTEVRYNAYRWLRDSGFNPVLYAVTEGTESMTAEQSGGLIDYQVMEASLNAPPLPGRLAFALEEEWGGLGVGFQIPGILQTRYQILYALVSLLLVSAGWLLIRPRKNILREDV